MTPAFIGSLAYVENTWTQSVKFIGAAFESLENFKPTRGMDIYLCLVYPICCHGNASDVKVARFALSWIMPSFN